MRTTWIALALVFVGAGCSTKPIDTPMQVAEPEFKSELPAIGETKAVSFLVDVGQTGGMGSVPVLTETGAPFLVNDLAVYADDIKDQVQAKLPACYSGRPRIEVRAIVSLQEQRAVNPSIPGPEVFESYYRLKFDHLDSITVEAEPCTE